MRVSCPACRTSHDLPAPVVEALWPSGVSRPHALRCAACRHVWSQPGPGGAADDPQTDGIVSLPDAGQIELTHVDAAHLESGHAGSALAAPHDPGSDQVPELPDDAIAAGDEPVPLRAWVPLSGAAAAPDAAIRPAAGRLTWVAWAISVLGVLLVIVGLWAGRGAVMHRMPATVPIYRAMGVAPSVPRTPAPAHRP